MKFSPTCTSLVHVLCRGLLPPRRKAHPSGSATLINTSFNIPSHLASLTVNIATIDSSTLLQHQQWEGQPVAPLDTFRNLGCQALSAMHSTSKPQNIHREDCLSNTVRLVRNPAGAPRFLSNPILAETKQDSLDKRRLWGDAEGAGVYFWLLGSEQRTLRDLTAGELSC